MVADRVQFGPQVYLQYNDHLLGSKHLKPSFKNNPKTARSKTLVAEAHLATGIVIVTNHTESPLFRPPRS